MSFVPRPILRSAGEHVVRRGEGAVAIAEAYGQPASSYRDLVAANPHKPLTFRGVRPGASADFAELREGERLRLPWFWFAGKNERHASRLRPGSVGSLALDPVETALTGLYAKAGYDPATIAKAQPATKLIAAWWRIDHPGGEVPASIADVAPYAKAGHAWDTVAGKALPPALAASIPWDETPWRRLARLASSGLALGAIDWAPINAYLEANVEHGAWGAQDAPVDFKATDFSGNVPGTTTPWAALPYAITPVVRWDLFPSALIDPAGAPPASDPAAQGAWLLARIKALVAAKKGYGQGQGAQGGSLETGAPNCASLGPGFFAEKGPGGAYTGACVGCGKNAAFNPNDSGCDCLPGFVLDPAFVDDGARPQDCVPAGGSGVAPAPPAADDAPPPTLLVLGVGLAIGALSLYLANRR